MPPHTLPNRAQNIRSDSTHPHAFGMTAPHVVGAAHVPQLAVRDVPQLSTAVTLPQLLPRREQNAASGSPWQPQTFAIPPPAHVCGDVQPAPMLQSGTNRLLPQLSTAAKLPQFLPSLTQNIRSDSTHPHTFAAMAPQIWGETQVPHDGTVRALPQLSIADTLPQLLPSREQNAASVSDAHTHTFDPLHVAGGTQVPQSVTRELPQLSGAATTPQFFASRVQNAALLSPVQPHTFAVPLPPQVCRGAQPAPMLQSGTNRLLPQLSTAAKLPQFLPNRAQNAASLSGAHTHTLPALHIAGALHAPQLVVRELPQLSPAVTLPQFFPSREQKLASPSYAQPQTFAVPPPAQVCGAPHVPHEGTVRDAPQLSLAVTLPQFLPSREQKFASPSYAQPHTFAVPAPPQV
jgi:hypothetical protein